MRTHKHRLTGRRELRENSTDAESLLWRHLRNRQLNGYKFRRQVPVGNYIADFACKESMLIVELDGGQHVDNEKSDAARTANLERAGYTVTRYWNDEVLKKTSDVLEDILQQLVTATPHPSPLPKGERELKKGTS